MWRGRVDGRRAVESWEEVEKGSRGRCGSGVGFILEAGHRAYLSRCGRTAKAVKAAGRRFPHPGVQLPEAESPT